MFIAERHALVTKAPEGRHVQFGLQYGNIDFAQITHKHQQVMQLRITYHVTFYPFNKHKINSNLFRKKHNARKNSRPEKRHHHLTHARDEGSHDGCSPRR